MQELELIKFLNIVEGLKSTLRHNWTKTGRQESVAEHTWRLVLMLVLIQDLNKYDIDIVKAIKILLIHDIPEVIDGDIPGFIKKHDKLSYAEKEIKNAKIVFSNLPKPLDKEYFDLYIEYDEQKTKESKLAKALDKIETNLQHMESGPQYWNEEEKGDHMLNYPNSALEKLNEEFINNMWGLIKKELEKMNSD